MIGVLCNTTERRAVQEFFELFKVSWEFYVAGRAYQVILSTRYEIPEPNAGLVIIFSSTLTRFDQLNAITVDSAISNYLVFNGVRIPIYGKLASLRGPGQLLPGDQSRSEAIGLAFSQTGRKTLRVGYDLFDETAFLLTEGQPVEHALTPTLESHIELLRDCIIEAGIPIVEIPPVPWGYNFIACLTHDVDFVEIRQHRFDHTFWGFCYRATVGSLINFVNKKASLMQLLKNWLAVLALPLVYLGVIKDYWDRFDQYAGIERGFSSTFFLIPFKGKAGEKISGQFSHRRATRYDIGDVQRQVKLLREQGFEIALHGIDAWHCPKKGEQELKRIREVVGFRGEIGVRMHWLCFNHQSPLILEQAGFSYDSTFGYNETVGFKAGTMQAFQPLESTRLLELPLNIQDTALFFPYRLAATEAQAWNLCLSILDTAARYGGVVTILWHMRSLAPERLWGEFYLRLLQELQKRGVWFGTAGQVVRWFRQRRLVKFEAYSFTGNKIRLCLRQEGGAPNPPLFLRVHRPRQAKANKPEHGGQEYFDVAWNGEHVVEISLN